MNLDAYLKRIAYDGPLRPDFATLKALHRAHLRAIPYENLDVQFGRRVTPDPAAAFEKIVTRKRGGWCYEMNGLFGLVLQELGFKVTRSAGAVLRNERGDEAIGNHLVLKVELEEGVVLADVGFGDGPIDPIAVAPGPFVSHGFAFGLTQENGWWRLNNHRGGGAASFDFNLAPANEALLSTRCWELQTAEDSPFVLNAVLQRHIAEGMWQMRGRVLRKTTPTNQSDYLIATAREYTGVLAEAFDLHLPEAADLWPQICVRHDQIDAENERAQSAG
ncbi:MAG: arylamine N-acetyltransferase [Rhizomicrobium sp.]|nr:arylamine N-acetyltransferase [Rhizomicrobium sp.]